MYCHILSTWFPQSSVSDITSYIDISRNYNYCCLNCILIIEYDHVAYALYVILVNICCITKHINTLISRLKTNDK